MNFSFNCILQAKINYYCRSGYYGHMEAAANEGLQRYGNDPVLKFFVAFAKVLQSKSKVKIIVRL